MLSSTAQLDYTLSGFTFDGISVPSAVLHIASVTVNDQGDCIVDVEIYATAALVTTGTPLTTAQWAYTVTDGQTMAQVWTSLSAMTGLTDPNGVAISLTGATAVAGE
jgi:hypothetical protein